MTITRQVMILPYPVLASVVRYWESKWDTDIYVGLGPCTRGDNQLPVAEGQTFITFYTEEALHWFAQRFPEGQFYNEEWRSS